MPKTIQIIGVPMDLGQSNRGVDMGPSAVRYAGLAKGLAHLGFGVIDSGNVVVPVKESLGGSDAAILRAICSACTEAYRAGQAACAAGHIPIFLGGDHSIAIGTIGGVTHQEAAGIIWIDAHGDFNLPQTSPNGNVHGMPVSILLGKGFDTLVDLGRPGPKIKPEDLVYIGLRDLDYDEKTMLRNSGVKIFTMRDIDENGIAVVTRRALAHLSGHARLHVSLDMDILDPREAPGVGTPAVGGLTYHEAHLLMEIIEDSGKVASVDVVEINPILDTRNSTAKLAVELVKTLFGKSIL
jgi:arginase